MAFLSSNIFHPKLTILFLLIHLHVAFPDGSTHLHFYMHDVLTGPNTTAVKVVPPGSDPTALTFGGIFVIDDPLTKGPDMSSGLVGQAQGTYIVASQSEPALLMTMNILFVDGEFNGAIGRDAILAPVRELPVVGGTGKFRKACGYLLIKTYTFNVTSGNAVLEVDVYVEDRK
ncbi:dirigent protein 21-like [Asparagus officinalis]|uniref:dirigent protein 21-like n=1 Tax=Asparagus officinalis TaxID=4686 RepID=UPI00098E3391|nr:dirigent protein 21-like [Asparagus officinalis]